ncbi:MAG: PadR family transcriptional regulator [Anaerolineae bacterium]|nr:PadR family transcriptional regulator [Anaerolineae bacterium]
MSALAYPSLTVEWSLLGFLAEQPMHGYELHRQLSVAIGLGVVWHVKQSQLYAILTRLEERGYIAYTLEPQDMRPPRKIYELTPAGEAAVQSWLQSPVEHGRDFRMEFLAKVYFAQRRSPAILRTLLKAQREQCGAWQVDLQAKVGALSPQSYEAWVQRFRLGQVQAMLQWLDESEAVLAKER